MGKPPIRVTQTILTQKPRDNSVLVAFLGVLITLLISTYCWRSGEETSLTLSAIPSRVFQEGEYWRLTTALAVHADMKHFLSNAVLFGLFSYLLYGYFGGWVFPVLSILLGSVTNYLSLLTYPPQIRLVGASGMVYLMVAFWLTMYILVERRLSIKRRFLHGMGVGLIALVPNALKPSVSYRTHAIGLGLGVLLALVYFLHNRKRIRSAEISVPDEVSFDLEPEEDGYIN